jgi:nitroreductase
VDLFEVILERRSVRAFTPEAVPDEVVDTIVDAARWAPSAGNCQARDFIVVKDPLVKKALSEAALEQRFIEASPITIVVCANDRRSAYRYGRRGRDLYCLLDAAAATQNLILAVHALGLGACWVGAFDDSRVGEALNLPTWLKPVAIIPIGYPKEKPWTPQRLPLKNLIHNDRYVRKPV